MTGSIAGTNIVSSFVNPPPLTANIQYWIGFFTDDAALTIQLADDLGTVGGYIMTETFSKAAPLAILYFANGRFEPVHVVTATSTYIDIDTPLTGV